MAHFDLNGASAIVTGGSRGVGPHIATALAERGARVALVARSHAELGSTAGRLAEAGHTVIEVAADVTSTEDRHRIVRSVEREFGAIDVLVNNAGGDLQREFHNLGEEQIEGVLELNLTSAVILTRLVLPGMLARERGHIVNISSMAGRTSFPFTEAYAGAKDGLIGFTRVLRGDYRPRGISGSTLILGPVRDTGVGPRTADEVGISVPSFGVSGAAVGKTTVRAIRKDKAELAVLPGPGLALRAIMDRFPGMGPTMNRVAGVNKTMQTVADYREREARLAEAEHAAREEQRPMTGGYA
jgi:short-subunit dehydrogenase